MGTAQDIANAALFLACDESAYVTRTLLPVDGGLHVRLSELPGVVADTVPNPATETADLAQPLRCGCARSVGWWFGNAT